MLLWGCDVVKYRIMICIAWTTRKRESMRAEFWETSWWEKSQSETLLDLIKLMEDVATNGKSWEPSRLLSKAQMEKQFQS